MKTKDKEMFAKEDWEKDDRNKSYSVATCPNCNSKNIETVSRDGRVVYNKCLKCGFTIDM